MAIYGYGRISRKTQNIQRQVRNILSAFPTAEMYLEAFTGTKFFGRKEFDKILKKVKPKDTIVFDEVSRMSRNAEEGVAQYFELFDIGVDLVFLKERYIDTSVYRKAIEESIQSTGNEIADIYIEATNRVIRLLAKQQIIKAFEQAQKEVDFLHQRTKEGIETARNNGKQIGILKGQKLVTKKSIEAKEIIKKHNIAFGGSLNNEETWKLANISKVTFYKYKKELEAERLQEMKADQQNQERKKEAS